MGFLALETPLGVVDIATWVKCLHSGKQPGMIACPCNSSLMVEVEIESSLELANQPASQPAQLNQQASSQ